MRSTILSLAALSLCLLAPRAHAESRPIRAVRHFFQALDRQDFGGALALTDGAAQADTSRMVSALQTEAARAHAHVEVKVTRLAFEPPRAPEARGVPVPVRFHIDVIGKKWMFQRVARTLDGDARFYVDPARLDRIIAIEGALQ
jgi:hypothetical protein